MVAVDKNDMFKDELFQLRNRLVQDDTLMEHFERDPEYFLGQINTEMLSGTGSENNVNFVKQIIETPEGIRFLTLDYCLAMAATGEDDPDITPYGPVPIPVAAANVLAIYNAVVIGNAGIYHDVLAGAEMAAWAVARAVTSTWDMAEFQSVAKTDKKSQLTIELSENYLKSGLHTYFQDSGVGESREKMLIRASLAHEASSSAGDVIIANYSYRGSDFELTGFYNKEMDQMVIEDGRLD